MKRLVLALMLVLSCGLVAHAQFVVFDGAVTARNAITATLQEYLANLQRDQRRQLRRMSRRLSLLTDLRKFSLPEAPRWRTHDFENPDVFLFARPYTAALNYGDSAGDAYLEVSQPVLDAAEAVARLTAAARRTLTAELATLDVTDATAIAGTNNTGLLRYNGRKELRAIEALEQDVTDGSLEQSTTAVLDKISGALLVGARQRQARTQLLSGIVEQLLVDSKRARDTETSTMNMQLITWRDGRAANAAFASGSGDALRTWRRP